MSVKYEHDCQVFPTKVPEATVDGWRPVEWTWRCPNCKQRWLIKAISPNQRDARRVELIDIIPMSRVVAYAVGGVAGLAITFGFIVELLTSH